METIQEVTETVAVDLGALLDAGDDAMVTLVAGDTQLVAHRAVLSDRSPVFAAMFRHDTLEARSGQVVIPDVEGPVLRQLLAYLYTRQVPRLPSRAPELLAAADKYGVSTLKELCEQQIAGQLSVETAAGAAVLAVRHSCSSLRQAAVSFLKANFAQVMATQGWADAVRTQPEDVIEVSRLLADPAVEARSLSAEEKGERLLQAAEKGAVEELQSLLQAGADVGAKDRYGQTALYRAAWDGHVEAASCLLENGAEVDARNDTQNTPLHSAADNGHTALVRLLLASSADPNARNQWRVTPLLYAALQGHAAVVRLLLAASADPNARNEYGVTALLYAAEHGHADAVAALLEAGAEVDARNVDQATPLVLAALNGHTAVVRLLLASSAYHSARNSTGWTPLHCAAENGHAEIAAVLLEAGADRAARTNQGETPLDLAIEENHQQLVDALS